MAFQNMMKLTHNRGITFVEIMGSLFIMGLLATWGVQVYVNFLDRQELNAAVEQTFSILQRARSFTLSSRSDRQYGVRVVSNPNGIDGFEVYQVKVNPPGPPCEFEAVSVLGYTENLSASVNIVNFSFPDTAVPYDTTDLMFRRVVGDAVVRDGGCKTMTGEGEIRIRSNRLGAERVVKILPVGVFYLE